MASSYKNSKKRSNKQVETLQEAKDWIEQIKLAKAEKASFDTRAERAYRDYTLAYDSDGESQHSYAIHWSNVNTIGPNIYFSYPQPRVTRSNRNRTNPIHILSSDILEKNLQRSIDEQPFNDRLKRVRDQYLNAGIGQVWVRYKYCEDDDGEGTNDISNEIAEVEVVDYQDFLVNVSTNQDQVLWVARAHYYTIDQFKEEFPKFPKDEIESLHFGTLKENRKRKHATNEDPFARTKVWEVWDSVARTIYFIGEDYADRIIDTREPIVPFRKGKKVLFKNFFPCPQPLLASTSPNSYWPVCDHHYVSREAKTLSLLSSRTKEIADEGLYVKGLYDQSMAKEFGLLREGGNGEFIPASAPDMAKGLEAMMMFWPVEKYAGTLQMSYESIEQQKQAVYEISGMSDILRGQGDPESTAAAEKIKSENASMRLEERRLEVKRFVSDVYDLMSEVICEAFHWRTVLQNAGLDISPFVEGKDRLYPEVDPQLVQAAMVEFQAVQQQQDTSTQKLDRYQEAVKIQEALKLLRDERLRHFAVEVDVESLLRRDQEKDKQQAIEFTQAVSGIIQQYSQIVQVMPDILPVLPQLIMFVVRKYDKGREYEQQIEQALEQFVQNAMAPKDPPPDYQAMQLQIEQQKVQLQQQELQYKAQEGAGKQQLEQMKLQLDAQGQQLEHAVDTFLAKIKEFEAQIKAQEAGMNAQVKQADIALKGQKQQLDTSLAVDKGYREGQHGEVDAALRAQEAALKAVAQEQDYEIRTTELLQKQFALEQEAKEPGNQYSDG